MSYSLFIWRFSFRRNFNNILKNVWNFLDFNVAKLIQPHFLVQLTITWNICQTFIIVKRMKPHIFCLQPEQKIFFLRIFANILSKEIYFKSLHLKSHANIIYSFYLTRNFRLKFFSFQNVTKQILLKRKIVTTLITS